MSFTKRYFYTDYKPIKTNTMELIHSILVLLGIVEEEGEF